MANVLVLYHSNTQRTEMMAQLVAQGAQSILNINVRLLSIEQATEDDILWCDGIAVGSPTNLGAMSWKMKKFWDDHSRTLWGKIDGKIACAFSSAGSYGGGNEMACLNILSVLINYGFLVFGVTDYSGEQFSPHYGAVVAGFPESDKEKKACLLLGQRLAEWTKFYIDSHSQHPKYKTAELTYNT